MLEQPAAVSPQQRTAVQALFDRYARLFNDGLAGHGDVEATAGLYANAFLGASPAGVITGTNDARLRAVTAQGFEHYRETGAKRMDVTRLDVSPIDQLHVLVHVGWSAVYEVHGERKTIPFTNAYLVRTEAGGAKVFGWVTGDEAALLKAHGIG